MKKIGIVPTIIERRKSNNLNVDNNLIVFLNKCFPNFEIEILYDYKKKIKLDIIIATGGNDILKNEKNNANKYRNKLDNFYFKYALKKNIPFLGICHGAQFIADYYKSEIVKKKNHTKKNHLINTIFKKRILVNSYHNFSIVKLGKNINKIAWTKDGSIEAFKHQKKRILGIMWHPERYKKIKKFDLDFLRKNL